MAKPMAKANPYQRISLEPKLNMAGSAVQVMKSIIYLYESLYQIIGIAIQHVDDRNLYHGVATRFAAERCTCNSNKYRSCQCRIVDGHIKLNALVLRTSGNTFTYKFHAMSHILQCIHTFNLHNVRFVMCEIVVSFDSCSYFIKIVTLFEFNINHTAMNSRSQRNGHTQGCFDAIDSLDSYGMSHAHTRTKI